MTNQCDRRNLDAEIRVRTAKRALRGAEVLLEAPPRRQDPKGALQMVRMALRKLELI
jgi:predicted ATP-grasp superfamily ATP-dependent carboligase